MKWRSKFIKNTHKITEEGFEDEDKWENRELGAEEQYVKKASPERTKRINQSLGLQLISIRLPQEILEAFKKFAHEDGIGYQPLIRQIITKYTRDRLRKKSA